MAAWLNKSFSMVTNIPHSKVTSTQPHDNSHIKTVLYFIIFCLIITLTLRSFSCQVYKVKKKVLSQQTQVHQEISPQYTTSDLLGPKSILERWAPSTKCSPLLWLHDYVSLLILHPPGRAMCQPATDWALELKMAEKSLYWTLHHYLMLNNEANANSIYKNQLCFYKRFCFPYWLIQAASSLVYATLLKKINQLLVELLVDHSSIDNLHHLFSAILNSVLEDRLTNSSKPPNKI